MKLKVAVGIVVLIILGFTIFGENGLVNLLRYKKRTQMLEMESERLKQKNRLMEEQIERLKTDPAYIERLAREELGMVKPGELVFQFAEPKEQKPKSP